MRLSLRKNDEQEQTACTQKKARENENDWENIRKGEGNQPTCTRTQPAERNFGSKSLGKQKKKKKRFPKTEFHGKSLKLKPESTPLEVWKFDFVILFLLSLS